jgi:hypothetical protein
MATGGPTGHTPEAGVIGSPPVRLKKLLLPLVAFAAGSLKREEPDPGDRAHGEAATNDPCQWMHRSLVRLWRYFTERMNACRSTNCRTVIE